MSATTTPEWDKLRAHHDTIVDLHLRELFESDPARAEALSAEVDGIHLDFSKQRITRETLERLLALAEAGGLRAGIDAMFAGEKINRTEGRAAMHIALRTPRDVPVRVDGRDVGPDVHDVLDRMNVFAQSVRRGQVRGFTGRPITSVVNIGIGGSDLGPAMACRALATNAEPWIDVRFVSNVDAADLACGLRGLDPETTLFVVSSKTFTTVETLTNARTARRWLVDAIGDHAAVASHFVAVSADPDTAEAFGISREWVFEFWDWVGGRFSLCSAIGLSVMIAIGPGSFREMLAGAHAMDRHFATAPLRENLPVLLGLLGIWNRNFLGAHTHAVLPYDERLALFPAYLQQLEMESNGKSVDGQGETMAVETAPIVWGAPGTNGQHAFFQLLHQGATVVPADFIGVLEPGHRHTEHHVLLMANLIAQSRALAFGKTAGQVRAEGVAEQQVPHRTFEGNRPSSTILLDRLTPYSLGQLVALYEHKVAVQGWLWGIDSFDQWGVELGKALATQVLSELQSTDPIAAELDGSTASLIAHVRRAGEERTKNKESQR